MRSESLANLSFKNANCELTPVCGGITIRVYMTVGELTLVYGGITIRVYMTAGEVNLKNV